VGAVFLDAGIVQWIEYAAASEQIQQNCPTSGCMNFMDAFYYVVATVWVCLIALFAEKYSNASMWVAHAE
jgi:hypothetical protein